MKKPYLLQTVSGLTDAVVGSKREQLEIDAFEQGRTGLAGVASCPEMLYVTHVTTDLFFPFFLCVYHGTDSHDPAKSGTIVDVFFYIDLPA